MHYEVTRNRECDQVVASSPFAGVAVEAAVQLGQESCIHLRQGSRRFVVWIEGAHSFRAANDPDRATGVVIERKRGIERRLRRGLLPLQYDRPIAQDVQRDEFEQSGGAA